MSVKISPKASIYSNNLTVGDNVRIDDFCIITGDVKIGNNVHIGAYTFISGKYGVVLEDYVQISQRVSIYSASDDYSGLSLVGPTIPDEFKPRLKKGVVYLERHALIGAHSVILPGLRIGTGASVGALSLVNRNLLSWSMYAGIPVRFLRERSVEMLSLEKQFEQTLTQRRNDAC